MLTDVENYCMTWGLKLNTNKTKIMIFEKGKHTRYDFYFNNSLFEVVESFKYLGVHLYKNNNWNRTQQRIAQHASHSLHNLFIVYNQLKLSTTQKAKLYDSLLTPVLNYASEVWGYHEARDVELVHNKFCRKILNVKKSTNIEALYGELGRTPMKVMRKISLIKFWIKILNSDENSLLYWVYTVLKEDADTGVTYNGSNWAYQIKQILQTCGLSFLWESRMQMFIRIEDIKQRILDMHKQTWYSNINNSTKLDFYAKIKYNLELEPYLDSIEDNRYRIALTRFRISAHDLAIETGRYTKTPKALRICINCN